MKSINLTRQELKMKGSFNGSNRFNRNGFLK